jgi:hypothetical protein
LLRQQTTGLVTPRFEERAVVRDAIQKLLRECPARPAPLCVEDSALTALARRIVAIDVPSATIRSKLTRALQRESVAC